MLGSSVVFTCSTLELPWLCNARNVSCIPDGEYRVIPHVSPHHGECFWLQDVPGRTEILIHKGNYYHDIRGCILVGSGYSDIDMDGQRDVLSSAATLRQLNRIWKIHNDGADGFMLRVRSTDGTERGV